LSLSARKWIRFLFDALGMGRAGGKMLVPQAVICDTAGHTLSLKTVGRLLLLSFSSVFVRAGRRNAADEDTTAGERDVNGEFVLVRASGRNDLWSM
jgi:hypothetical protein